MANPAFDQDSFEGYDDDGGEGAATSKNGVNGNWTQLVDIPFRARFLVQETAGVVAANQWFKIQYNLAAGGWNDITPASAVVKAVGSANTTWLLTDEDATTQQIGAGAFEPGAWDDDGVMGENNQIDMGKNEETELESCLQIISGDVVDAQTLQLRIVENDGTVFGAYTNTPTVTVNEPAGAAAIMNQFQGSDLGADLFNGTLL